MSDSTTSSNPPPAPPLLSDFAGDPEMGELIEYFLEQLPAHVDKIVTAVETGDARTLGTIAHQLKGSGAGYGFAPITSSAATLEDAVRGGEADIDVLRAKVDDLIQLCQRAVASGDPSNS
jgi:HPt (histidine-containing phosphotransfer) domain-containing protein